MRTRQTGVWHCLAGLVFAWLSLLTPVDGQTEEELLPVQFNLATRARISVNATCGEAESEVFCKLVEHDRIFPAENRQCDICDARHENPALRHPISNAVDGSQKWWQSPTLANGPQYNYVTITLELQHVYQVAYIILKAANAPRPGNWILERSIDGVTYYPWQYFAISDRDCQTAYGMFATPGLPVFVRDDQVICTTRYSAISPLEGGEIFVSLITDRPGAYRPSKTLVEFTSARFIRMRFQKIRTLLGDLMDVSSKDPENIDSSVTKRYFYSIKDISIGGQCICYGHARFCRRHDRMRDRLQCQCEDNTMGDNCELCKPLFNQKPWQVKSSSNGGCEECNCHNKAGECVYNATVAARRLSLDKNGMYSGGGVCLNCLEFTTGINCEQCLPGYFRLMEMDQSTRFPCRPCNCLESHSSTANCVQDDSRLMEGLAPGDCLCKEGYTGRLCDSCSVGYYGYPNCRQCRCDIAGTKDPDNCYRQCVCKENVAGSRCDVCKDGHFNLDINNNLGCTKCFCFGASTVCNSVSWGLGQVYDMGGWKLSQLKPGGLTLLPQQFDGWLEAKVYVLGHDKEDYRSYTVKDIHYWLAPMSYSGNRLSSYGGNLSLFLRYRLDETMRNKHYLRGPNFVLQGSNLTIKADVTRFRENQEHELRVHLHESSWRHLEDDRPVTRAEMLTLLYNLERLLIRATFNTAQDTVYIQDVKLDSASPMVMDGTSLKSVEQCRCPMGYAGLSCESCIPGWRRVNNQLVRGRCRRCQCHNHAHECDPYTGKCLGCKHSTTGDYCERCLPGFYGDPRNGSPDDCKPCACPLVSGNNFFAERCVARPSRENPDAYECVNCMEGYTGVRCQSCAPGFYGNPIVPGGSCRRCRCGGNIDPTRPGSCNSNTGACNLCTNNTEGVYCERCIPGYYGSAVNGDCRPCQCSEFGSTDQNCDPRTGQCTCRRKFVGRKCDRCQRGYGNVEMGCERCNCNQMGSESLECEPVTGQCRCRPGIGGMSCSQCRVGYYDFSRSGCKDCGCYKPGTSNAINCDLRTGTCICKPGVIGKTCNRCEPYHFGLESGNGCTECDCDGTGSESWKCDDTTGQCTCKPGVGGRKCDRCLDGYFGFSTAGCQVCEPCEKTGHKCDPVTGACSCPTNTEGPTCQVCVTDAWGYDKDGGCKRNVEGQRCERCKPNSFSLDMDNPYGCTQCYCFLRSQTCSQAPYVWSKVNLPHLSALFVSEPEGAEPVQEKFDRLVIHSDPTYVDPDISDRPLYWHLNVDILGTDLVLSYNGRLVFYHYFEGSTAISKDSTEPIVVLIGNDIELHYDPSHLEPETTQEFIVKFHEELWHVPGQTEPVDRRFLMIALQNVTAILVRAVQEGNATYAFLHHVYIETAVPEVLGGNLTERAIGVEICDCPDRYSGESCQNPGPGYFRVPPVSSDINLSTPETIIGRVRPCRCFQHTQKCDPDTGECLECMHNTVGRNCERCAEGYYGVATRGTPDDCQPCRCPLPDPSNNFSPTCEDSRAGLICTACRPGYEGSRCERCAAGFYGNPQKLGDICKPCICSLEGSRDQDCDRLTGQCLCFPGISGRTCEVCTDTDTGVQEGKCVSCYLGCTGVLLSDLANMTVPLLDFDPSGIVYPWDDLHNIQTQVKGLKGKLSLVEQAGGENINSWTNEVEFLHSAADSLLNRTHYTCDKKLDTVGAMACKVQNDAANFLSNITSVEEDVNALFEEIKDMVDYIKNLTDYLRGDYQGLDMTEVLEKARKILAELEARNFTLQDKAILAENMAAEMLAEQVENLKRKNIETNSTQDRMNELIERLRDVLERSQAANNTAEEAWNKIEELKKLLDTLNAIKKKIEEMASESQGILDEAEDLLEEADIALYTSVDRTDALTYTLTLLRGKVNKLRRAIPYLEDEIEKAMIHALMLQGQANELDGLYEQVRNQSENAVKAAKAYESIRDAINDARKSADQALEDAKVSKEIAGVDNMTDEVARLFQRSKELKMEAERLLSLAQNLTEPLKNLQDELDVAQADHDDNQDLLDEISSDLGLLQENLSDKINDIFPVIEDANKKTQATLDVLKRINRTKEESQLEGLKDIPDVNQNISDAIVIAKSAADEAAKVIDREKKLDKKMSENARKAVDISYDLETLKAKIRDARQRVNDMKLSLRADGQCYRTYRSTLKPSATNEVHFAFKPESSDINNALLVLLEHSAEDEGEEFLAADIDEDGKVRFSWNSGLGKASVTHNQLLEPDVWYHVEAKRIGSIGQLKVWPQEGQEESAKKETTTIGAGCSLMNLNENTIVYLAGSNNGKQIPVGVSKKNFTGCMGEIFLDTHRLGVYNFKSDVPDHCKPCDEVPQPLIVDKVYVFNGRGFARRKIYSSSSRRTKLELEFKTFYEDSKIVFVGSETNGDFLSLDLKDGKVAVSFYLGGISYASAQTVNTYNDNKWVKIIFDRNRLRGTLIVREETITFTAPAGNDGLNIAGSPMYFGGLPTTLDTLKFKNLERNEFFFGCMQKWTYFNENPEKDTYVNVQESGGCRKNGISNVDFRGDGYLALKSESINLVDEENDISFTFVTNKRNAVILLARDIDGDNYYSISLVDGRLVVRMKGVGSDTISLQSQETFNDGTMHCVSLIKQSQRFELKANGEVLDSSGAIDLQFPGTDKSTLYLGGYPARNILGLAPTEEKFDGCISDVIINGNLLSMADATQYVRADVGRCRFTTDLTKPVVYAGDQQTPIPTTTTAAPAPLALVAPESCAQEDDPEVVEGAHSVGLTASFHAKITKVRRRDIAKSFTFTFDFRTFYENGLFGYLNNAENKFYLGIQLVKGQLEVAYMYDGSRVSLSFDKELNDGQWHSVLLEKAGKILYLSYDDEPRKSNSIDARLDVKPPLNLGGPTSPEYFKTNDINLVNHSVRGCIRNLTINGNEISISDVKVIQDAGKCYKDVEPGVYFGGDAWGVYDPNFVIGNEISISLDFKTTSTMGVLVSVGIAGDSDFGMTLELHNGKVKFGIRNEDGEFRTESDNTNTYLYCDNQWHNVRAEIAGGQMILKVDEGNEISTSVPGVKDSIGTPSPLFIGGTKSMVDFKQPVSLSQDTFNGCMKKLTINKNLVDWYDLKEHFGLRKNACPKL